MKTLLRTGIMAVMDWHGKAKIWLVLSALYCLNPQPSSQQTTTRLNPLDPPSGGLRVAFRFKPVSRGSWGSGSLGL